MAMQYRFVEQLGDAYLNSSEFALPIPKGAHLTGKGVLASPV
jgi:hypothetical protein